MLTIVYNHIGQLLSYSDQKEIYQEGEIYWGLYTEFPGSHKTSPLPQTGAGLK